ncbi:MAG: acyltransferase, partial [Verrucomicrobia bacterium]|nr:acyltransferase [Verrucomicrobiota bacterium]
ESGAYIGSRVTVKNNVLIWQGIHIEDDVFVGPGVIFTNDRYPRSARMANVPEVTNRAIEECWLLSTRICRGSSIGAGVVIMPGLTIGAYAMVAAGTVVTKSVSSHQLVAGNPGQPKGWACFCGMGLDQSKEGSWVCKECNKQFQHTADQGFLVLAD